ncbi:MAG: cell division transport system permease protein [Dinoroseobacter sp.]
MKLSALLLLATDRQADRIVPPTGYTARLTLFTAAAMAFLAIFAIALSLATSRVASQWSDALARSSTIRISAPAPQMNAQIAAVERVLQTTPGIADFRVLSRDEQAALLEPWLGAGIPIESLPVPALIEVVEDEDGFSAEGLRLRLRAEAPGAVLDDHTRWRQPLVEAARGLRVLGLLSLLLIAGATGAMITLAAQAALAANRQVIQVLRLVGARDTYIAGAFMRRFTNRAALGATVGSMAGVIAITLLPGTNTAESFLTDLGFQGAGWLTPLLVPPAVAALALLATRAAAERVLKGLS